MQSPLTEEGQYNVNARSYGDQLTLDIGAGDAGLGTINIDVRSLPGIDVVCDALHLPFKDRAFHHLYLRDVIEHFRYDDVRRLLWEARRVLKRGGVVDIWTPNFQSLSFVLAWVFGDSRDPRGVSICPPLTGDQDYPENVHLSQWSLKFLGQYIQESGLRVTLAKTIGSYRGKLRFVGLLTRLFRNRGGIIYVRAAK